MNRTTIILIALLIVLGLIAYYMIFKPSGSERMASYTAGDLKIAFDSSAIMKLEIKRLGQTIVMENQGGKWEITAPHAYKANQTSIAQLLGGISHFKVGSLVSSNPAKQALYNIDSTGTGFTVTDRSNKTQRLIIGKPGPSYSDFYFRMDGSNDVYLGEGFAPYTLNQQLREWRDKTIYNAPSESITGVEYDVNGQHFALQKDSTKWKLNGDTLSGSDAGSVASTLSSFNAEDFIDTIPKLELAPIGLNIHGVPPAELKLYPLPPDSSRWVVQSNAVSQVFTVGKWTVQQLMKPVESKLTVRGGKKKR